MWHASGKLEDSILGGLDQACWIRAVARVDKVGCGLKEKHWIKKNWLLKNIRFSIMFHGRIKMGKLFNLFTTQNSQLVQDTKRYLDFYRVSMA